MGKASISIAVSGSYNGSAIERAQKSLDRMAKSAAASSDTVAKSMMDSGSKVAELGGKLYTLGDSVDQTGQRMTKGLTVPIAAAGAGALAAAVDFDTAGSKIDAACGDAAQGAETLKNVGRNLYKDGWGESMDALSDSLIRAREILGDLSETDMSYAVEGAMTLERAYGSDFSETLRGVNVLMEKFGLSATEATDLMVSGTQRGLDYTKELGDNLSEYSGRWADAGMSASQYFSLLEAGAQNGAYQLDKVGDFLNEFLTSLTDGRMEEGIGNFSQGTQDAFNSFKEGGASAEDVLNAVIGELANMPDGYQRAQIASELWSSLGEDNAMSMITALSGVQDSFTDVSGSAEQAGDKINDSLQGKATQAVRTAQEALEPFASVAVDMLGTAADTAKGAADEFSKLDEGTQQLIVGAGLLAAAAGPVVSVGGKVVKTAGSIATAYGKAKQDVAVYADALTTTNAAALKAYDGNEKLAKALERNPAVKAAGGVKQYVDAVTDASKKTAEYDSAVRKLSKEQEKGSKASAEVVSSLQSEVAERKSAMDAAKGTVEGYKASAAAAQTSTAAVTAQSVAMKAAAVAGTALKAALATCIPIAIITGIVSLVSYFQQADEKARTFAQATDGLTAATSKAAQAADGGSVALQSYGNSAETAKADIDGMLDSQAQLAQTITDTNNSAAAQTSQLQAAYSAIQQYANHSDLSTDAQNRLKAAVETVNSMCGTQISVTDAANGKLADEHGAIENVTQSLGDYINKKLEQIQIDAQQQNLTALYEQQAQDIAELAKAQKAYNDTYGDMEAKAKEYYDLMLSTGYPVTMEQARATMEASASNSQLAKDVQTAQSALDSVNTSINNVSSSMTAQAAAADGANQSLQNMVLATPTVTTAINALGGNVNDFASDLSNAGVSVETFRSLNEQQLTQLATDWVGTGQSIVNSLNNMGVGMNDAGLSAATALANGMQSGKINVDTATSILKAAASGDWSGVAQQMADNGANLPQSVSDGITANSFKASGATSSMLSAIALILTGGDVKAAANLLGHDIDQGLADGIANGTLSEEQSALLGEDVIAKAKDSLESHSPSQAFYRIGTDIDAGLALGISGEQSGPLDTMFQLGQSLIQKVSGLPQSMNSTGSNASRSLASGIGANRGAVSSNASALGSAARGGVSSLPGQMGTAGSNASSRFASGIGGGVGSTRSSASRVASAASNMSSVGNMYSSGTHLVSNFASGISAGINWVANAAWNVAQAAKNALGFSVPKDGPWSGSEKGGETSGLHLAQNFAAGMEGGIGYVSAASNRLAEAAAIGTVEAGVRYRASTHGTHAVSERHDERQVLAVLASIENLLREIASKDGGVYMDSDMVSAALAKRSVITARGRGYSL